MKSLTSDGNWERSEKIKNLLNPGKEKNNLSKISNMFTSRLVKLLGKVIRKK